MFVLLQQVRLLDPVANVDRVTDVLLEDGVVRSFSPSEVPQEAERRSCLGWILAPGLIDLYSHSGEPGFEERETLESLQAAAIAGGFTRLNILPDTNPAIDQSAIVAQIRTKSSRISCWGALTLGVQGQQMTELTELAEGVIGFSDGKPISNLALVRRLLEYLQPMQKPIALWASDPGLTGKGVIREGVNSMRFGLPGVPIMAESAPLSALLECIEEIGTPVHLMRISTARGVELVRSAKARGVPITASTTWLHLLLSTDSVQSYDPSLRLDPPLGNPNDRDALIQAVSDGVIDAIAVDHTPYTYEEKTVAFGEAPSGAIGLELALPLLWSNLVESGRWSALDLWRSLSVRPAQCLGQDLSAIAPDQPSDLILFNPNEKWTVDRSHLRSLSTNTAWFSQSINGRVLQAWCF
ncbi:dihydroorotase [Leptolyngbya sp. FACHB-17]|uniref:dihydroorotase n=1 Tax=unclassified Leptolyngbya TaxID=2650499 RepID=UPI001680D327|nr:dihydroorotase [Leptolyngbya sp. FACHB-17]MBD2080588.1 dihydroorotase [Leptolyngbya sp. FACHB-17]